MGEIAAFVIGGVTGIIVSAVGYEKIAEILKEAVTEILPVILSLAEGII